MCAYIKFGLRADISPAVLKDNSARDVHYIGFYLGCTFRTLNRIRMKEKKNEKGNEKKYSTFIKIVRVRVWLVRKCYFLLFFYVTKIVSRNKRKCI